MIIFGVFDVHLRKHPRRISVKYLRNSKWYRDDYRKFKELYTADLDFPLKMNFPCLNDKNDEAGTTKTHYFIQDLFVAQDIYERQPNKHVDVGSSISGFVAHVASFREIELLDIRCMESDIKNVTFRQADVMDGTNIPEKYCDSVSSLHALEHFGLGRYGDPIDPNGHLKGFANISKMLKPNGIFYFSVPMGKQRIDFNAHRVFGMPYLIKWVSKDYDVLSFSYIDDGGTFHCNVDLTEEDLDNSFGCFWGCAIFILKKK